MNKDILGIIQFNYTLQKIVISCHTFSQLYPFFGGIDVLHGI